MESGGGYQASGACCVVGGGHSVGVGCLGDAAEDGGTLPLTPNHVGAGLLAQAVCQSTFMCLKIRFREQARSHI
ncbi:hypothetical protein EMIT0P218_40327 [Pseudomonas sp. IT-P218]